MFLPVGSPLSLSSSVPSSLAATPPSPAPLGAGLCSGMNANARPFYPPSETVESVVGEPRRRPVEVSVHTHPEAPQGGLLLVAPVVWCS